MKLFSISPGLAVLPMLALFTLLPSAAEPRTFTDLKGRKIEAEIIKVAGKTVTLRLTNGNTATIPINTLSKSDQVFVEVWGDMDKKSGTKKTGESGKSAPAIPDNLNYKIEFKADKERTKKGTMAKVDSGEVKTDEWGFNVELENRSGVALEGLEVSYRIYVDPKASAKVDFDSPPKFYGGRLKVDPVADRAKVVVKTKSVPLQILELDPGFVFTDGSRNDLEDDLEGIWIKVWHGEKKVAEYKSNKSTVKEAKWTDDEAADPDAEPESEEEPKADDEAAAEE